MLKINHIRLFKKLGKIFLATLLCILLVFNAGIIDCFAVAGTSALLLLLGSILASCGITFATYEAVEAGTSALYDNMDGATQSIIDKASERIQQEIAVNGAVGTIGIGLIADYWSGILKAVIATFGTYEAINTITNLSDPSFTGVTSDKAFFYTVECNKASVAQYQINNMTHTVVGWDSTGYTFPSYVVPIEGIFTELISIADDLFTCHYAVYGGSTFSLTEAIWYDGSFLSYGATSHRFSDTLYFNGTKLVKEWNSSNSGFALTANGINIVQSGYIMGTDIPLSTGICPDGIWTEKGFSDWLNDLIFGNTLPGNPGIDAGAYPGNDVWHDGSINDDIAVGSPSIGIAVPTTGDDVIGLNPDIARDYTSTGTKIGDIAGDTTGDITGDSSGDTTLNPPSNGNTGALPALSLPELLFKEKFPFCLPWDLYSLFSMLSAEPVTPRFEIPFTFERFGIDESIVIDFSQFEEQIAIVRFFIGAGFVLGLILISRKIIGAG